VARLHGAVSEEHGRHLAGARPSRGQRGPESHRHVPADDARGTHEAMLCVDQVHRAAEPATEPVIPPHQLRHHATERSALRDRVPMRPVAAVDGVVVAQLPADRRGHRLLADAQVDQPVHLVCTLQLAHALLEEADPPHRAEHAERVERHYAPF
jgi:hypothetical protein